MKNGRKILWLWILVVGAAGGFSTSNAQRLFREPLYGVTFFGNQLVEVDPVTGFSRLAANLSAPVSAFGIASRYGRLYSFDPATDQVIEINPLTGQVNQSIDVGLTDLVGEGDIAFRSDGVLFISVALDAAGNPLNQIYAADIFEKTSRLVGSSDFPYDALAFDSRDALYALAQGQGNLYIVNQSNGTGTSVGSLGIPMNSPFAAMSFAPDGTLYAAVDDRLYTINTNTAAASPVDANILDLGFSSVSGLAFQTGAPDQELIGLSFFSGELVQVDQRNGVGHLIGTNQSKLMGVGLAVLNDRLYTFDAQEHQIYEIDPATGRAAGTNAVQIDNVQGEGDIALRSDGTGFLSVALDSNLNPVNALYFFDLINGTSSLVGISSLTLDALAFAPDGTLYALAQGGTNLYTVNQTNAALTAVGPLGVPMNSPFSALTFESSLGLLAVIDDRLFSLDAMTGAATTIDPDVLNLGFSSISGLAVAPIRRLGITHEGSRVVLFRNGLDSILQSASNVTGPYSDEADQSDPQVVTTTGNMFYRLRRP